MVNEGPSGVRAATTGTKTGAMGSRKGVRAHWSSRTEKGAVEGLPLLRYVQRGATPAGEVLDWFAQLKIYVLREFGELSELFDLGEDGLASPKTVESEFRQVRLDVANMEGVTPEMTSFVEKENVKLALQALYRRRDELAEKNKKVFGLVLGQLSKESREAMRAMPSYAELESKREDTRALLHLVVEIHLTRGSSDRVVNQQFAREMYEELRVNVGESLFTFKSRFEAAVTAMRVVGEPTGDAARIAADFVRKLELSSRYREAVISLQNNNKDLNSIEEAIKQVSEFKSPVRTMSGLTFKISAESKGTLQGDHDISEDELESKRKKGKECWECGNTGHIARNCPSAKKRQEQLVSQLRKEIEELKAERAGVKQSVTASASEHRTTVKKMTSHEIRDDSSSDEE